MAIRLQDLPPKLHQRWLELREQLALAIQRADWNEVRSIQARMNMIQVSADKD